MPPNAEVALDVFDEAQAQSPLTIPFIENKNSKVTINSVKFNYNFYIEANVNSINREIKVFHDKGF